MWTHSTYLDDVRRSAALGYRAVKIHMHTDPEFDLDMVKAVARAHRDSGLRFMVDLEQCYTFDEALRLGEVLGKLPFDWMEAPLPDHDLDAYVGVLGFLCQSFKLSGKRIEASFVYQPVHAAGSSR